MNRGIQTADGGEDRKFRGTAGGASHHEQGCTAEDGLAVCSVERAAGEKPAVSAVEPAMDAFRDAALSPSRWPFALAALGEAFNSDGATLVLKTTTRHTIAVSSSIQPFVSLYMASPICDPREQRVRPAMHQGFMPDHAYFSDREIANDPYYQEFLLPNGFGWNATATLYGDLMVSVKRAFRRGRYEGAELVSLNAALPWLRSLSRMACLTWNSRFESQLLAFEQLQRGAILLDARGRVLASNALVQWGDGLDVVDGFLDAPRSSDRDRVRQFAAALISAVTEEVPVKSPDTLALPRTSGGRPWLLDGIAAKDAVRSLHSRAAALVLVTDLEAVRIPQMRSLREVFHLTPTEAELARRIAQGDSLQQAAACLSITHEHARQRLKSIFVKTRTCRQGELVSLLARFF
jgi:DNA-binding CsgD family transcriptional regulator